MNRPTFLNRAKQRLVTTRTIFIVTIVVAALTTISIWLFGLGQHRTIFENSILSTTVLSIAFFLFLTIGLYRGIKLKDDIGRITDKIRTGKMPDVSTSGLELPAEIAVGDGIGGIIIGILLWLLFTVFLFIFLWIFGAVLWAMILVFAAMLYWIFFRALRLVFKNSNRCKDDLLKSSLYGFGYTVLYNFWIYGIILGTHYLI